MAQALPLRRVSVCVCLRERDGSRAATIKCAPFAINRKYAVVNGNDFHAIFVVYSCPLCAYGRSFFFFFFLNFWNRKVESAEIWWECIRFVIFRRLVTTTHIRIQCHLHGLKIYLWTGDSSMAVDIEINVYEVSSMLICKMEANNVRNTFFYHYLFRFYHLRQVLKIHSRLSRWKRECIFCTLSLMIFNAVCCCCCCRSLFPSMRRPYSTNARM